ncbi:sigma-54 dependent transcriptional regulator [Vibrio sp. DW001]|uniref:sigma-54-dependent transcriptional regulator n=1 Tax=Vibrio sp. DW001 TaxID=2912315 RepID=UPI0023AE818B|nr:sigma-54 dependent transcriptional regulator [Vibrio sp. DW001]WED28282.1 sigma-54 dependent transcriptional regulator [Vibrio sp. DW001]
MPTTAKYTTDHPFPIDVQYQGISILIVDDEDGICDLLFKALSRLFRQIDTATTIRQAEQLRQRNQYDLVLLDINLPDRSGMDWHEVFENGTNSTDVIFITGYANLQMAIKALKLGASDFILKPFNIDQIYCAVKKCIDNRIEKRNITALKRDVMRYQPAKLIGNSAQSRTLDKQINQYAPSNAVVLIQGESGTGKELVARELHLRSGRSGAFVPLNCGSMDAANLANELFGYCDAHTSNACRDGLLRIANGGTLFLDEVSELPHNMQSALLRVLEERVVRPLGANRIFTTNVRIVAATNKDLKTQVDKGEFRQDLYYRLNVLSIHVAPLRERSDDLVELIPYFTRLLANEQSVKEPGWGSGEIDALQNYHWPGNIRELRNLIERCILTGNSIAHHWHEISHNPSLDKHRQVINIGGNNSLPMIMDEEIVGYPDDWEIKAVEKAHIVQVVNYCDGNKTAASKKLKISRKTLDRKFKEWGT